MNLVVAISGATGAIYGVRLLEVLHAMPQVTTYAVLSHWARQTIPLETGRAPEEVLALADRVFDDDDLAAAISSGSFRTDGMIVIPCSMKTVSAIASGYGANLLVRAVDVCLKESRRVVLVPREMPLSRIHLDNLKKAADYGCILLPPMLTFYNHPTTVKEQVDHIVGKVLMQFGMEHKAFIPWEGK